MISSEVLPEVGVEGEAPRSSQGISVPVSCEDTQSTSTVRSAQETESSASRASHASGSMRRRRSLGPAGEEHRRHQGHLKESFPRCAGRAGPLREKDRAGGSQAGRGRCKDKELFYVFFGLR